MFILKYYLVCADFTSTYYFPHQNNQVQLGMQFVFYPPIMYIYKIYTNTLERSIFIPTFILYLLLSTTTYFDYSDALSCPRLQI